MISLINYQNKTFLDPFWDFKYYSKFIKLKYLIQL